MRFLSLVLAGWLLPVAGTFAACTLVDITTSGFGSRTGTENMDSREVAGLTLNCNSEYRIALDAGVHYASSRRLSDGTEHFLNYALWTDAGGTVPWGDNGLGGTYPANPLITPGNGTKVFHPLYGTASTADTSHAGLYTDTVHVTIAYPPYNHTDQLKTDLVLEVMIMGTCTLDSSGVTGFGIWPSGAADIIGVALGTITVTCMSGTRYAVGIDAGLHWNARVAGKRHLANGNASIPYILWADAGRTTEWGDTGLANIENSYVEAHPAPGRVSVGTGRLQTFFLWGDVLIQGVEVAGTYNDTVIVTVVWP